MKFRIRVIYFSVTIFSMMFLGVSDCFSQNLQYQKVIETPGLKASEIIERANRWAIGNFNSYQDVLQYRDSTNLVLSGIVKTISSGGSGMSFVVVNKDYHYNFNLEAKQGRSRITISNFRIVGPNTSYTLLTKEATIAEVQTSGQKDRMKKNVIASLHREYEQIDKQVNSIINGIESGLLKKDDW